MILLVRDDRFLKYNDRLYNVGSSSNTLYKNNCYAMGEFKNLSWVTEASYDEVRTHEELGQFDTMHLVAYTNNIGFKEKCKLIEENVKQNDIIVAKLSLFQAIIACHYALKHKKVLVVESASDIFAALWYHGGNVKYKLAALPLDVLVRYYHKKANYIIYVSKEYMQERYKSNAISIGCSDAVFGMPEKKYYDERIQKILSYTPEHEYSIGLIGETQAEYRGHDVLIKACAVLVNKGYKVRIKFLGGGSADLKRIQCAEKYGIKDRVEFCGRMKHDEVFDWLRTIDVLVMPTKVESLGRAVLEAMSVGCPVIGSSTTALRELLQNDCLAKPSDYHRISEIIENMICNQKFLEECVSYNFAKAQDYSSDITNVVRRDFYQNIIIKGIHNESL